MRTGIVRRIDDLGRIVLPKELRRSLGISKGNPLEIGIEGRRIVLEKYSSLSNLEGLSGLYLETLYQVCEGIPAICNKENILAAKGCSISTTASIDAAVKEKIKQSKTWFCSQSDQLSVFPSGSYPIRVLIPVGPGEGRPMEGAVLLLDNGKPYTDKQISFASYTAILISRLLKNIEE